MKAPLRALLRTTALLALFAGACELGMRDKSELSGGGGKDGGAGDGGGGKVDGGTCDKGYSDCDGVPSNGCETYVLKDPKNCGACKNACPSFGTTPTCDNGKCGTSKCTAPSLDCDSDPATCETNSSTSTTNCGYCGHACSIANAVQSCVGGQCQFTKCQPGFDDCDGVGANGCEASLTSATDCGACGKACSISNGTGSCTTGTCTVGSCNTGYADCDKSAANGCESNLATDPANCGACGNACAANQVCKNDACQATTCTPPMADCDSNPDCETNVQTSVANCGFCNNPCSLPNATPACSSGVCTVQSCNGGFADCDSTAPGCETTLGTVSNCASCGDKCTSGPNVLTSSCSAGKCTSTCLPGYGDCSATAPGCESDFSTDVANCGSCGHDCNALAPANTVASCNAKQCVFSCKPGYGNCSSINPDCETNLATSAANCGDCGHTCPATSCNAGLCVPEVVNLSGARALDVTPNTVYVGRSPGGLSSFNRTTWANPVTIDGAPNVVSLDFYTGTNTIYFVDPGVGVQKEPGGGGFVDTLLPKSGGYHVDASPAGLYATFTTSEGVLRTQLTGGGKTNVDTTSPVHGLRADTTVNLVAWALPSAGEIHTSLPGQNNFQVLATGQSSPEDVAVDNQYVYWTNNGDGTIMRMPRNQSTGPVTLATGQTGAFAIAVSTTDVYWTTDLASGGVYKVAITGGTVKQMAANCAKPEALVVDDKDLIWAEFGSGQVKRVPK